jgi:SlyX protein
MTDDELSLRIERLESRLMHQDAALEELTRMLLAQEERIREQSEMLKRLREHLRTFLPSPIAPPEQETPPPHY